MESSIKGILITALIIIALWSTGSCSATSTRRNLTLTTLEDADEDLPSLTEDSLSEFRERYRRLIPYMTYYVSNNYVNPQSQSNYQTRIPAGSIQQLRRPQYSGGRVSNAPKTVSQYNYLHNSPQQINQDKFIPSVQYDPDDIDNEEYFTPVRYNQRLNFEDYQALLFRKYQNYESTSANGLHDATTQRLHFTTVRPTTKTINFTPASYPDILPRKQQNNVKHPTTNNFVQRPTLKSYNFDPIIEQSYSSPELFEPMRFTRPQISQKFAAPLPANKGITLGRKPDVNLNHIVKSLQLTNQLPEVLNADNIDDSIKTLVEILSLLNNGVKEVYPLRQSLVPAATVPSPKYQEYNNYKIVDSRPNPTVKPFQGISARPISVQATKKPQLNAGPYHVNIVDGAGRNYLPSKVSLQNVQRLEEPRIVENLGTTEVNDYKIVDESEGDIVGDKVVTQHLTTEEPPALNYPAPDGVLTHTQNFPPTSVKYGATRGKPNVDYPAYAVIPKTEFTCTTQRYKGFFGDPDTGCQVWHYCDLNGGKSSFLCPNGTIFSQVALTCDWWFNVKCESTAQLYVLNERLYKYILPVMPKFPEDFSGPEVDRYLEIKFKEMEKKMKEKKLKKQQEEVNKIKNSKLQSDSADTE